jgi:CheY-like chemotaxis protein
MEATNAASWDEALESLSQAEAGARGFAAVIVQTSAAQPFAEFVDKVRARPPIARVEILAWGRERLEPQLARLRELGVKVGHRSTIAASDLFNALVDVAAMGAGAAAGTPRAAETAAPTRSDPPPATSTGRKVLVVEDNLINQKVVSRMLQNFGCEAEVAGNGAEALKALDRARYDLILMDCQMPEMDGYQATAEIRRRDNGQQRIPIVALTAHAMQGDREKCLAAGMDDYLSKPIDPKALTSLLRRWGLTPDKDGAQTVEAGKPKH